MQSLQNETYFNLLGKYTGYQSILNLVFQMYNLNSELVYKWFSEEIFFLGSIGKTMEERTGKGEEGKHGRKGLISCKAAAQCTRGFPMESEFSKSNGGLGTGICLFSL